VIIEAHNNRNGKSPGNIQSPENFHTHIEVRSTFFNRIHVGEVGEIAQVYFLEADAHPNESLSVAGIGVMAILMVLTDLLVLKALLELLAQLGPLAKQELLVQLALLREQIHKLFIIMVVLRVVLQILFLMEPL
jgi:hypothetical protein